MKIASAIGKNFNFPLDKIDEYNIKYIQRHTFDDLLKFVSENKDKRINIEFEKNDIDIYKIEILCGINSNIHIRLNSFNSDLINQYKEKGIKFFFNMPVCSYSELDWYLTSGTTDIYIYNDLCFNLSEVSKQCKEKNISIRMVLNRIPSSFSLRGQMCTSPIFRPEDYDLLSLYIDTAEFDCYNQNGVYDYGKFKIYYKNWFDKKKWDGDLSSLNLDLAMDFPNQSISPDFTNFKINCKHKCSMSLSNKCNNCKLLYSQGIRNKNQDLVYERN